MLVWAVILSAGAMLVAVGTFLDKFAANKARDDKLRLWLVGLYLRIDRRMPLKNWTEASVALVMALVGVLIGAVAFGFAYIDYYLITDSGQFGFLNTFWTLVYDAVKILQIIPELLVGVGLTVVALVSLLIGAYALITLFTVIVLNQASAPGTSPFAFGFAVLGLAVTLGKLIFDATRALFG